MILSLLILLALIIAMTVIMILGIYDIMYAINEHLRELEERDDEQMDE